MKRDHQPTLTDTYTERKKALEKFQSEYKSILRFLKDEFTDERSIDLAATETQFKSDDTSMMYVWVVILNITTMDCVLLKIKSNTKMHYYRFIADRSYKSAEKIAQSRILEGLSLSEKEKRIIDLKHLVSNPKSIIPHSLVKVA